VFEPAIAVPVRTTVASRGRHAFISGSSNNLLQDAQFSVSESLTPRGRGAPQPENNGRKNKRGKNSFYGNGNDRENDSAEEEGEEEQHTHHGEYGGEGVGLYSSSENLFGAVHGKMVSRSTDDLENAAASSLPLVDSYNGGFSNEGDHAVARNKNSSSSKSSKRQLLINLEDLLA
jgi:hypothetical protein